MNAPLKLDVDRIRIAIDALLVQYPELADDEDLRADTIDGATDLDELLTRLIGVVQDARVHAAGIKDLIGDYHARVDRLSRRAEAARCLILKLLLAADLPKRELPAGTVSTRSVPPTLVIDDEAAIPAVYQREKTVTVLDKNAVKEALARGVDVPGARLTNGDVGLTIRIR